MTDKSLLLPKISVSSQAITAPPGLVARNATVAVTVETVEEEPYTIKCICDFSDDDGNTIYCETCDTWQHIDCFYPDNRDEAIREDFAHSCAECKPRPLDRQKAIERTLRLRNVLLEDEFVDKKAKRPPSKSQKKKVKPNDVQPGVLQNTSIENSKHGSPYEQQAPQKKIKSSHRPSHSVSSQPSKRSPLNPAHPPSPATTPPDLPDDFQIHHYSVAFCSLYNEQDVPDTRNNAFASLAIPTALARWLREPDAIKKEVGRTHSDVFQALPLNIDEKRPKLEVKDSTRALSPGTTLRWRSVKSTTPIDKDVPLIELNGEIGFQKDYCADLDNLWNDLSSPLPFVFFHPILPLYIDTRKEGSLARFVRRSCKPNAQLDTYLSDGSEYHFWLVSDRCIPKNEQITLPWDFRLDRSVHARWLHLLGLKNEDSASQDESELDTAEYTAISNWIDRILSEYGGCACDLDNNCAFARFHRHHLFGKNHGRSNKNKSRKATNRTISPTCTSYAANSRPPSESQAIDNSEIDARNESNLSRSKPPSRDWTPMQGQFDQLGILTEPTDRDKRKVAMVEDSFRRMEQQQPPRKKKRVSDGSPNPTSVKPKSRTGSVAPSGRYTDAATSSRSKSSSPASMRSPNLTNGVIQALGKSSITDEPKHSPSILRRAYRHASVQTDPVSGQWYSGTSRPENRKKRFIPLSRRLLRSRLQNSPIDEERKKQFLRAQTAEVTSIITVLPRDELNSPVTSLTEAFQSSDLHSGEGNTSESAKSSKAAVPSETGAEPAKTQALQSRVLIPPGETASTPISTSSTITTCPAKSSIPGLIAPLAVGSFTITPSPIKKKLSLSDYTKSRMNKVAGKVTNESPILKPGLASPDETKTDGSMEQPVRDKSEETVVQSTISAASDIH